MAVIKCYLIRHEGTKFAAWVDDSGKDKPVDIISMPTDTPLGSIVRCVGRWKFSRGEGYSFHVESHEVLKRGNGGRITIKSRINKWLHIYGIGINGIWIDRRQDAEGCTLLTSDGINKITLFGNRRDETVHFSPKPDTKYTLEIRNKGIFLTYRISDEAGNVVADFSMSYLAMIAALLVPLAGLVGACVYYAKGNRIGVQHSLLTSYLSWFLWGIGAALTGLNVPFSSFFGAAWVIIQSLFMQ